MSAAITDLPRLLEDLSDVVGGPNLLTRPDALAEYSVDWTGRFRGGATAVAFPAATAEVSEILRLCGRHGVAAVPQGGNTGLVGGAVPAAPAVVVSTRRLDWLGEVDPASGQVSAGAGVTLERVQEVALRAGWDYPVDLAARGSATVGGTVATNAGGHRAFRHGMTRRQLVGIEAVLVDGSVLSHLGGLVKDNTGYDLAGLFCGSEGTLGIVTAARLAALPACRDWVTCLVGFESLPAAMEAVGTLRTALVSLEAVELMLPGGLAAVASLLGTPPPLGSAAAVLLIEATGGGATLARLADVTAAIPGVIETAVATSGTDRAALWRWRELHSEAIQRSGSSPPHKLDVTVPISAVAELIGEVDAGLASLRPGAAAWYFGHAADGNVHVNVTGIEPDDEAVDELVLNAAARLGGSISAEHGIGRAKRRWLHLSRSQEEIRAFRSIKAALDPEGIMNPGVLLP